MIKRAFPAWNRPERRCQRLRSRAQGRSVGVVVQMDGIQPVPCAPERRQEGIRGVRRGELLSGLARSAEEIPTCHVDASSWKGARRPIRANNRKSW